MTSEFDLNPQDRVRLYREIFGLSSDKIRRTKWYHMCGRKQMYCQESDAVANIGKDIDSSVKSYRCPFPPSEHFHLGHLSIQSNCRHTPRHPVCDSSDFGTRIRRYFKEHGLSEIGG